MGSVRPVSVKQGIPVAVRSPGLSDRGHLGWLVHVSVRVVALGQLVLDPLVGAEKVVDAAVLAVAVSFPPGLVEEWDCAGI